MKKAASSSHAKPMMKPSRKSPKKPSKKPAKKTATKIVAHSKRSYGGAMREAVEGVRFTPTPLPPVTARERSTRKNGHDDNEFVVLREGFGVSKDQMASLIGLNPTTYGRREAASTVELVEEHRLHELQEAWGLAVETFHTRDDAREWFHSEIPSLESEKPIDVMVEPGGVARVKNILQRIYYGGY